MLTRKAWSAFLILIVLILGTAYSFILNSVTTVSNQAEIDSNQRLAEKADANLTSVENLIRQNEIEKAKLVLKAIGKSERVACVSLLIGDKTFSYPETCDVKQSDRTIVVGTESGSVIKIDTGLTLREEIGTKLNLTFLLLLLSFGAVLFLFSMIFSMAYHWMENFFAKRVDGGETPPSQDSFFFRHEN